MHAPTVDWRAPRYKAGKHYGHYESWFIRANYPERSGTFWIRYIIYTPTWRPQTAEGKLWAIYLDGERIDPQRQKHIAYG